MIFLCKNDVRNHLKLFSRKHDVRNPFCKYLRHCDIESWCDAVKTCLAICNETYCGIRFIPSPTRLSLKPKVSTCNLPAVTEEMQKHKCGQECIPPFLAIRNL